MTVGEAVVSASQRGHDLADLDDGDEDEALRRLASVLMYGRGDPSDLVAGACQLVCVSGVVTGRG